MLVALALGALSTTHQAGSTPGGALQEAQRVGQLPCPRWVALAVSVSPCAASWAVEG